jgi:high affinity Mn2+ porin
MALASNAISRRSPKFSCRWRLGFMIGDGDLNYGRQNILETYYMAHLWRGVYVALDLQYVRDPAYNRDRGPVIIPGFRVHVDL